ncbi:iron-sulfur cluster biosynthesis protein Isd11 [Piptocephalis cylindrospora]|uniref:Iron-sulfur cluster biosynthesis protein Isd11 n=1 Tax=Piptocephalis cylindrospora TaxID=1907219 RepID=A0A4P9Y051_9FUNG|nr:iron-sulfur cluster biosynthesis protein Isd11 [Piptocephalis cylindrospora]|eukprot:RKP11381.1 iron-sulfur cluster biosynthesis protein Isd11 [Piptocephalis cylindrospora]
MVSPSEVTQLRHLYRSLLRTANNYCAYNFRDHANRRVRRVFREKLSSLNDAPSESVAPIVQWGNEELAALRRQVLINSMYQVDRLVVEEGKGHKAR